ncbi:MAG: hypothetical protein M3N53_13315 [Actinomycetota bacterium]|nr:hypothetical protein [Actinomycetota bacterium]
MNAVDRKTIKIMLACLELEVGELADRIGYDQGYVVNVLNGFTKASPGFRRALGDTLASLMLGPHADSVNETYSPEPLVRLIESRAAQAPSKREFYRELGTNAQAIRNRKFFDGIFVDRICCALGVHPSSVYGIEYEREAS